MPSSHSIPLSFELSCLAAFDSNPIDRDALAADKESHLHSLSVSGTTELIHGLLGLERVTNVDGTFARLPPPNYSLLPRSKPLPKPKPLTRWEKFAKTRGIVKTKNSRKVLDESTKEYRPAFGYGSKTVEKDWIMEVPANAPDQTEDQFEKKANEKKERIATNAKRQKRNQEEAQLTLSGKDIRSAKKKAVEKKLVETKFSTASIGKFDKKLKNEDKVKLKRTTKRKFESNTADGKAEKDSINSIMSKVLKNVR